MIRHRLQERANGGGNYFSSPKSNIHFIKSGCKVLDLALGGGWAMGRIANIVGDKSTGKTLLCIEAAANFAEQYANGKIYYREAEAAFDKDYAGALGMPLDRVEFGAEPLETVEDFYNDLLSLIKRAEKRIAAGQNPVPTLYICDSLDALSDVAEMEREFGEGSYGTQKAKAMSEMFRRHRQRMARANITLIIVSQVRDKINASFGRKTTRGGGRALDFYASQVVYLAYTGEVHKTVKKIKRPIGVKIEAKIDKNKIAQPFRQVSFDILFGYGIDDEKAGRKYLADTGNENYSGSLSQAVERRWYQVENTFLPTKRKYGGSNAVDRN